MRRLTGTVLVCTAMVLLTMGGGASAADGDPGAAADTSPRAEVSRDQYDILIAQCRYAGNNGERRACEARVEERYRVGRADPGLDCRRYAGVTVCGELELTQAERACVADSVNRGLSRRRAEVECYVHW